jgi:hypothetical protein
MLGNDFHGPAHFHASGRLPFPHQCPPVLSLERPGDRGKSGRELVVILHGTTTGDVLEVSPRNVGVEIYQP